MGTDYVEKPVLMRTTAPNENLSHCVLLVERRVGESFVPQGSAFLLDLDGIYYAVTARHVVQQSKGSAWADLYPGLALRAVGDGGQNPATFRKPIQSAWFDYSNMFVFHADPVVDVAVFPTYRTASLERTKALPRNLLQADENVLGGEDIHLLGFPAMYGSSDGRPVIRSGTIAYKIDRYSYLLDATSWHGDSGGLVCSKPYFGVPRDEPSNFQWQKGGKVIGLLQRYDPARMHGLPEELESFRIVVSAEAIRETLESVQFRALHERLVNLAYPTSDPVGSARR